MSYRVSRQNRKWKHWHQKREFETIGWASPQSERRRKLNKLQGPLARIIISRGYRRRDSRMKNAPPLRLREKRWNQNICSAVNCIQRTSWETPSCMKILLFYLSFCYKNSKFLILKLSGVMFTMIIEMKKILLNQDFIFPILRPCVHEYSSAEAVP